MLLANKHHIAAIFSLYKQLYPSNYTPIVEFGRNIIILYQLCDTWNPLQNFQRSLLETVPFIKKQQINIVLVLVNKVAAVMSIGL